MSDWGDIQFASFCKEMQTEIAKIFIFLPYRDHTRKGQITYTTGKPISTANIFIVRKKFQKVFDPIMLKLLTHVARVN